ncbi:MAG: D-alanine--D-alanine ligase [Enterobacterales bacterium]|nr:D-alanine--D-alanine ligase [Enterobacterales bacterium]
MLFNTEKYGKVAVLMGGNSNEREVSLRSGHAILQALTESSIDAHEFDTADKGLSQLKTEGFDRAFIALHGHTGENGTVQATLGMMDIPYTGSDMTASAIGMDKVRAKWMWQGQGLQVIPGKEILAHEPLDPDAIELLMNSLGTKLVVKPVTEGSSLGMSICRTKSELITAVEHAHQYSDRVLVERWMSGPEYTVAILNGQVLPSIRIQPQREFYDYEAKYDAVDTEYYCPSGLTQVKETQLAEIALAAFDGIGCKGWGRVDFMRDSHSEDFYLMEINTVPGMTQTSLVPKAAQAAGLNFRELCISILDSSVTDSSSGSGDEA